MLIQKTSEGYLVNGETLTLAEVVDQHPTEFENLTNKVFKSREEKIEKTALTEFARTNRKLAEAKLSELVKADETISSEMADFKSSQKSWGNATEEEKASFIANAEIAVDSGKGQRT